MKLWDKGGETDMRVIGFTSDRDRLADAKLAGWDIVASMAHCVMLNDSGLLTEYEMKLLLESLAGLFNRAVKGEMVPGEEYEDIHSMVEDLVTLEAGEAGMKMHAGRSRNDQIATDINLYLRFEMAEIAAAAGRLAESFIVLADRYREVLMPGYSHLQPAMPSTFGLWFGSYAESLCDDMDALKYACDTADVSPAGTAAGYGTTLPLRREVAARLLRFSRLIISSPYAQLRRGRSEKEAADAIAAVAQTIGRFSGEACLFLSKEFGFIAIEDRLSTGSSIMPQKRNPDVFELIRARSNVLRALPNTISLLMTNLPGGYNRDYQVLKEVLFPAVEEIKQLVEMTVTMIEGIRVSSDIITGIYNPIFSADEANRLVMGGIPFRKAYRLVASEKNTERFRETPLAEYTHLGSPGNPGTELIARRVAEVSRLIETNSAGDIADSIACSFLSSQ